MTEREWLAATHPLKMLDHLDAVDALTDRKQRLLDCACVRRLWHLLRNDDARRVVEIAERYADGAAELDEMWEARGDVLATVDAEVDRNVQALNCGAGRSSSGPAVSCSALSAAAGVAWEYRGGTNPLRDAASALSIEGITGDGPAAYEQMKEQLFAEQRQQVALLREIFGNPFRPVTFSRDWRTSTVVLLAAQMYDSCDFSAMPILADALQDAGCDSDDILAHCREANQVHVRGCWAVDLVLGKE